MSIWINDGKGNFDKAGSDDKLFPENKFSKEELETALDWYKYVVMMEDVPIHEKNVKLAYKIQYLLSSNRSLK